MRETVRTLPRGSASGFSSHARQRGKGLDEPPAYETLKWTAEYVPRTFVLNPSLAPEPARVADDSHQASALGVTNQVSVDVHVVMDDSNQESVLDVTNQTEVAGVTDDSNQACAGVTNDPVQASELDVINQVKADVYDPSLSPEAAGVADDPHQASALAVTNQVSVNVHVVRIEYSSLKCPLNNDLYLGLYTLLFPTEPSFFFYFYAALAMAKHKYLKFITTSPWLFLVLHQQSLKLQKQCKAEITMCSTSLLATQSETT